MEEREDWFRAGAGARVWARSRELMAFLREVRPQKELDSWETVRPDVGSSADGSRSWGSAGDILGSEAALDGSGVERSSRRGDSVGREEGVAELAWAAGGDTDGR